MRINFSYISGGHTFTDTLNKELAEDLYRMHGETSIDAYLSILEDHRNIVIDVVQKQLVKQSILDQLDVA